MVSTLDFASLGAVGSPGWQGVPILDMSAGACRMPVAEARYCGKPALRGCTFCLHHAAQQAALRDRGQRQSTMRMFVSAI